MTRLILAALMSTALTGQADALSCLAPTVQGSFSVADDSDAQYVLAVGRIQLLEGEKIPDTAGADPNNRQGYSVKGRFDGQLGTPTGFDRDAVFPITVEVGCAGAWCGGVPMTSIIAFIERRGTENVLVEGPCPMFALDATNERVDQAVACLTGGACDAPQ